MDPSTLEQIPKDPRWWGMGKATLQLGSHRQAKKTIFDHSYQKSLPLFVGLVGYLKSPFEPRIAAMLIQVHRGWRVRHIPVA
jgi:hypothetical protein